MARCSTRATGMLPQRRISRAQPADAEKQAPANGAAQFTDADRAAVRITRYDLDVRIVPATSRLTGRARLTVRNASENPLPRIALQISSTLTWESASVQGSGVPLAQHLLDTDADHTGRARELILTLPKPLAPGESLTLDTFYSGTIAANGERLERLGAPSSQALETDWDGINSDGIALRGFGNVLWFPVAAPQLFLQDHTLVPAVGRDRLEHAATPVSLRLSVEFSGEAPTAAYFCGRRQPFTALHDNNDAPIAFGSGIATVTFPAEPIGCATAEPLRHRAVGEHDRSAACPVIRARQAWLEWAADACGREHGRSRASSACAICRAGGSADAAVARAASAYGAHGHRSRRAAVRGRPSARSLRSARWPRRLPLRCSRTASRTRGCRRVSRGWMRAWRSSSRCSG